MNLCLLFSITFLPKTPTSSFKTWLVLTIVIEGVTGCYLVLVLQLGVTPDVTGCNVNCVTLHSTENCHILFPTVPAANTRVCKMCCYLNCTPESVDVYLCVYCFTLVTGSHFMYTMFLSLYEFTNALLSRRLNCTGLTC